MDREQELEWAEAQKIVISQDLVAAAKQQLRFLATVDRNRHLYGGPALDHAIYRYKYCWLPLLAKHAESQVSEGPLVVPLDCEWIWHCHRLNPVQYKADCEEFYGRILDNWNVVSSVQGTSGKQTEAIWNRLYPNEPYELDLSSHFSEDVAENILGISKSTKYDLVSAVKRQSPFFYQVSRPNMNDELFLEGAVARYKGLLHLIKRNRERSLNRFCVPTLDIDLIWHSHQLHPVSYCKDLVAILGKVLEHDDTDSDRTEGKKLDVGFCGTTKQWEEMFGSRYWRAGAMDRGSAPSPLTTNSCSLNAVIRRNKGVPSIEFQNMIQLPKTLLVEVMLEIVEVKNSPAGHEGSLFVSFSKTQPDVFFNNRRRLSIVSNSEEKQVAAFQCAPTGELLFELLSSSPSQLSIAGPIKILGTTLISLEDLLMNPVSTFSVEKWFELVPNSGIVSSKPIRLRIALSFTPPILAPYMFRMIQTCPLSSSSCFSTLPGRALNAKSWTCVVDEAGNEIISIQMRDSQKAEARKNCLPKKEVIGMSTGSCGTRVLAEFVGTGWSLMDSHWFFQLQKTFNEDGHIFELTGSRKMIIFPGRKLEYEAKNCEIRQTNEWDFMTIVEFSAEDPSGKGVALLNLKSGFLKVNEEWLVLPAITLAFILSDILSKDGCNSNQIIVSEREVDVEVAFKPEKGTEVILESVALGGCGFCFCNTCGLCSHGHGYENIVKSSGCGGCGGGGCGGGCGGGGSCRGGGGCGGHCGGGGSCSSKSANGFTSIIDTHKEAHSITNKALAA